MMPYNEWAGSKLSVNTSRGPNQTDPPWATCWDGTPYESDPWQHPDDCVCDMCTRV